MNRKEFLEKCKYIEMNVPAFRGAKQPKFKEYAVNEQNFLDGLRFKAVTVDTEHDKISISWIAQDWDENPEPVDSLVNEILRYYNALAEKYDLEEDIDIEIAISSRYSTSIEPHTIQYGTILKRS